MKRVALSTFAVALLGAGLMIAGSAEAGNGGPEPELCKISQGQINMAEKGRLDQAVFVGANRNTNAGKGNGGEIAIFGIICINGIPVDDQSVNIDAFDNGGIIATDPGNSAPD